MNDGTVFEVVKTGGVYANTLTTLATFNGNNGYGVSVTQAAEVAAVHYLHVELDRHEVMFAEGAAAESFVDDGSRGMFHNAGEFAALYPGTLRGPAVCCAPRVEDGVRLEAVKRAVDRRAGVAEWQAGALRGSVDGWHGSAVIGWAQDMARPESPVLLEVAVDGRVVGRRCQFVPAGLARERVGKWAAWVSRAAWGAVVRRPGERAADFGWRLAG